VAAADLGIGNVVHASFQILHSVTHASNAMVPKVVVEAEEEAAMVMVAVVEDILVVEDTDGEITLDHHLEVAVVAVHADRVTGTAHNVSFQTLPPENVALNVQLPKIPHSDNQKVLSPAMRICQRRASLTGQHFVVRRMITCPLQQHLATRGHVRADDQYAGSRDYYYYTIT